MYGKEGMLARGAVALMVVVGLVACGGGDTKTSPTLPSRGSSVPTDGPSPVAGLAGPVHPAPSPPTCLPEANSKGSYTFAQYADARRCVDGVFSWPQGRYPDTDALITKIAANMNSDSWQKGGEYAADTILNQCAWYITWLGARKNGDAALEKKALDYIMQVIPNYQTVIPGIPADLADASFIRLRQDDAAKAALGDPTSIQGFVDGNCAQIPWKDAP